MADPQQQESWRAYLRGSRLLRPPLDRDLQSHGVQLSEYEIISMLSESPGCRLRMSTLADLVVQSRSRLTHTAARLEKRGWVRRESCLEDRRGVELVLTDTGREAVEEMALVHIESVRRNMVDTMTPEQLATLGRPWVPSVTRSCPAACRRAARCERPDGVSLRTPAATPVRRGCGRAVTMES